MSKEDDEVNTPMPKATVLKSSKKHGERKIMPELTKAIKRAPRKKTGIKPAAITNQEIIRNFEEKG